MPIFQTVPVKDLLYCPKHILSPKHWLPVHHVEECNPELIALVKEKKFAQQKQRFAFDEVLKDEMKEFIEELRKRYGR